jgi:hypothetical protein
VLWVLHLCALAEASVLIHDQGRAARLYELLSPYADRNAVSLSTMPFGPVALRLGMLAAMLGRWQEAERHFQVAMERCRRLGARAITARVLYEWSRMLLARGAGEDRAAAVELLSRAQALCRELHLAGVAERVTAVTAAAAQPARPEVAQPAGGAVFRREATTGGSPTGVSWPGCGTPEASATWPACWAVPARRCTCSSWWASSTARCRGGAPPRPA